VTDQTSTQAKRAAVKVQEGDGDPLDTLPVLALDTGDARAPQSREAVVTQQIETIRGLLGRARFRYANEIELHAGISALLNEHGITVTPADREVRLSARDRIDFLLPTGLGIEVKVDGTPGEVWRQMSRYAGHDRVVGLLLVTTRARHAVGVPTELSNRPVSVVVLRGGIR
jgi:hypothetical protein